MLSYNELIALINATIYTNGTNSINAGDHNALLQEIVTAIPNDAYIEKTSTYTALTTDGTVNCTSGTFDVTLPVTSASKVFNIKNSGVGVITIKSTSGLIEGLTEQTLASGASYTLQSTGTNYIII